MAAENMSIPQNYTYTGTSEKRQLLANVLTQWIWAVLPPIITALGTFGNTMTLVILHRLGSGTTNIFLRALAISDLILLYIGLFDVFSFTFTDLHDATCKLFGLGAYSSGVLSAWLVVAMTVQRALSVIWPHRVNVMCTRKHALMLISSAICFNVVLHSHLFYGTGLNIVLSKTSKCGIITEDYHTFMTNVWSWVDLLSFSLLICISLIMGNTVLVWKLRAFVKSVHFAVTKSSNNQRVFREKKLRL